MISDLKGTLAGMEPVLHDGVWVYVVLRVPLAEVVGMVREVAGLRGLLWAAWITLGVQSDLAGEGLGAAIAGLREVQARHV